MALKILDSLVKAGDKETVDQYRTAIRNSLPLNDNLLEIHHALEMCGYDFNSSVLI